MIDTSEDLVLFYLRRIDERLERMAADLHAFNRDFVARERTKAQLHSDDVADARP